MPTYQYRCADCGHELEAVQKFTDHALTVCPTCEGTLRKVYNAVGVHFKGSGFYATDNRSKSAAASTSGAGSSDPGSTSGAGSTSSAGSTSNSTSSASSDNSSSSSAGSSTSSTSSSSSSTQSTTSSS